MKINTVKINSQISEKIQLHIFSLKICHYFFTEHGGHILVKTLQCPFNVALGFKRL